MHGSEPLLCPGSRKKRIRIARDPMVTNENKQGIVVIWLRACCFHKLPEREVRITESIHFGAAFKAISLQCIQRDLNALEFVEVFLRNRIRTMVVCGLNDRKERG